MGHRDGSEKELDGGKRDGHPGEPRRTDGPADVDRVDEVIGRLIEPSPELAGREKAQQQPSNGDPSPAPCPARCALPKKAPLEMNEGIISRATFFQGNVRILRLPPPPAFHTIIDAVPEKRFACGNKEGLTVSSSESSNDRHLHATMMADEPIRARE
jgi:hypothetical protein